MAVALAYRQSLIQQVTLTCFGVFILQNLCWARGALLTCLGTFAAMTLATSGGDLICLGMFLFARTAGDGNAVLACFGMFWDMVEVSDMLACFGMFWSLIQVVLCHVLACFMSRGNSINDFLLFCSGFVLVGLVAMALANR